MKDQDKNMHDRDAKHLISKLQEEPSLEGTGSAIFDVC